GLREVEHGVEDVSGVVLDRAVTSQQRGDTFPLSVRQVGAVASRAHGSGRLVSGLGLVQTPTGAHRLQLTRSPNSLSEVNPPPSQQLARTGVSSTIPLHRAP